MDKLKGLSKGGWHPPGDLSVSRETWKSDLKGIARGKKKDPYDEQRNHESTPLQSLKDPDSFGPPPRHYTAGTSSVSRTSTAGASAPAGPSGGWGAPAVDTGYAERRRREEEARERELAQEEAAAAAAKATGPYRANTSGLRTDNLPKPPVRRNVAGEAASSQGRASPVLPPRAPPRHTASPARAAGPPPSLPPRQNEYPDEHTPAPPPTYGEAVHQLPVQAQQQQPQNSGYINQGAAQRLGQAGVSIPGFGIGGNNSLSHTATPSGPQTPQLSELQQRFARMGTGSGSTNDTITPTPFASSVRELANAAHKKAPPPPPPKKLNLGAPGAGQPSPGAGSSGAASLPPPLPLSSKPRPS